MIHQRAAFYWFARLVLRRASRARRAALSDSFHAFWDRAVTPCVSFAFYVRHPRVYLQARSMRDLWRTGRDVLEV